MSKIQNPKVKILTGNDAVAEAIRQIEPDVVAAYPITPSTKIPEKIAGFVASKKIVTEFVPVESEHSAMSACVGAAATGARAFTATSSQGLALMTEVLWNAAGMRLPIVLANANRALSAPLSIHGDHNDVLSVRDAGWLQFFADSPQETYDLTLQSFPIAEKTRLPVMICFDGFETSHLATNVKILPDEIVKRFVGDPLPRENLLDFENPHTFGSYASPDYYFEFRRQQYEAFIQAEKIIEKIGKDFNKIAQRNFSTALETYQIKDAEIIAIVMGSAVGAIFQAIQDLRADKIKVGVIRIRTFRPFPVNELNEALKNAKKIVIFDRTMPVGAPASPLYCEISSILTTKNRQPKINNQIFGIGQRQFSAQDAKKVLQKIEADDFEKINFIGLRDDNYECPKNF
jgi:pyruvate ferredoxin oxidoreductase alpha subunit